MLDRRLRGTTYLAYDARSVVNSPEATGMGFWSINPYVGCEFGCTYCYARFTHRYVLERARAAGKLDRPGEASIDADWEAFEHSIFVKRRDTVLAALERDLSRIASRRKTVGIETVVIGTATDPYQPAERSFGITQAVLERLSRERGMSIGLISKSPLIARDVDLFRTIQAQNHLAIHVSLISTSPRLIRWLEARSPMPHARLRALQRLTAAGINAGLITAPILPGVNDSARQLTALLSAAKRAGARFAHPSALRLYPAIRDRFNRLIEAHSPELARRYRAAYVGMGNAPGPYTAALKRRFRRIADRLELPMDNDVGREITAAAAEVTAAPEQLGFWPPEA